MTDDICIICYEDLGSLTFTTLECKHVFHLECVKKCRSPTCPLCRAPMKSPDLTGDDLDDMSSRFVEDRRNDENTLDYSNLLEFDEVNIPLDINWVQIMDNIDHTESRFRTINLVDYNAYQEIANLLVGALDLNGRHPC